MSYFKVGDPETLVECPYNKTHMIRNKRMQYHLIDCRKQHAGEEMKVCPYNAKHIHPKAEHAFHLVHCTDRELIDRDIIFSCKEHQELPKGLSGNTSLPVYTLPASSVRMQTDEDWDSDACAAPFSLASINSLAFTQPRRTDASAVRLPRDPPTAERPTQSQSNTGLLGQSHGLLALASDVTAKQSKSGSTLASLAQQQNSGSAAPADVRLPRTREAVPARSPPLPTTVGTGVGTEVGSGVSTGVNTGIGSGATTQASVPTVETPRLPAATMANASIASLIHLNLQPVGRGRGSMLSMAAPSSTRSQPGLTAHVGLPGLSAPSLTELNGTSLMGQSGSSLAGPSAPNLTGLSGSSLAGFVGLGRGQMIRASNLLRPSPPVQHTNSTLPSATTTTTTTTTTINTSLTTINPPSSLNKNQVVHRQATATAAFSLSAASVHSALRPATFSVTSGVGRGYAGHVSAPNARDLPLPVFGADRRQTVRQ